MSPSRALRAKQPHHHEVFQPSGAAPRAPSVPSANEIRLVVPDALATSPSHVSGQRTGSLWLQQVGAGSLATHCERGRGPMALVGAPSADSERCRIRPGLCACGHRIPSSAWRRADPAVRRSRDRGRRLRSSPGVHWVARSSTRSTRAASPSCPSSRSDATPGAPRSRTRPARATPPWRLRGHPETT